MKNYDFIAFRSKPSRAELSRVKKLSNQRGREKMVRFFAHTFGVILSFVVIMAIIIVMDPPNPVGWALVVGFLIGQAVIVKKLVDAVISPHLLEYWQIDRFASDNNMQSTNSGQSQFGQETANTSPYWTPQLLANTWHQQILKLGDELKINWSKYDDNMALISYLPSRQKSDTYNATTAEFLTVFKLNKQLPHILIDEVHDDDSPAAVFQNLEKVNLEGVFGQKYNTYTDHASRVSLVSMMTPDVMEKFLALEGALNVEIIGDKLITSIPDKMLNNKGAFISQMLAIVELISGRSTQTAPLQTKQPSATTATVPEHQHKRRSLSIGALMAIGVVLVGYVIVARTVFSGSLQSFAIIFGFIVVAGVVKELRRSSLNRSVKSYRKQSK